jgi:hypothetical protein
VTFEREDPRLFFYEAVCEALGRLRLKIEHWTEFYLVDLLVRQVSQPVSQEPFVSQLEAARRAASAKERFLRFKEMGDSALVLVGFYEESIERRGVTKHYVRTMGGGAYRSAASLSVDGLSQVYVTLSDGFDDFVHVLDEVREMTSLRTPQDIVKLYEKWQRTGSGTISLRLQESGVFPAKSEPGQN